ncbi:acyltransferase family protein [Phytoactinopolyspora mesophila]|nr:acyltransferase [Phytoactinopolyspora mesophila]
MLKPLEASHPSPGTGRPSPGPDRRRDPFVDVLRVTAIVLVVAQHWLMPAIAYDDGVLTTGNALATPGAWAVTWLSQVMPLVFFAGGAAAAYSLIRRPGFGSRSRPIGLCHGWLDGRLLRLVAPVVPLIALWLPLPHLLLALGVPADPVETGSALAGRLLWFLALYVLITALTPTLLQLHQRLRGAEIVLLAVGALLVDVVRFGFAGGTGIVGYANVAFVWIACYQLGIAYSSGRLRWMSGWRALVVAGLGLFATTLAVAAGPYPGSMIGMPGEPVSNMNPPTFALLTVTALQLGLALALRPALERWAAYPPVARGIDWLSARLMTIYVWHMPALIVVGGVSVVGFGWATPALLSAEWRQVMPLWLVSLSFVLAVFVRLCSRVERSVRTVPPRHSWPVGVATVLIGLGLLMFAVNGFSPALATHPLGPVGASLGVVTGVGLLLINRKSRPTARPAVPRPRPVAAPARVGPGVGVAPPTIHQLTGSQGQPEREKVGV